MCPHYIFTPECRCDRFVLRLRFDIRNPPKWVRRVNGETVRTFDDPPPGAEYLTPDAAGELILEFGSPVAYLGYGAQWQL